MIRSFQSLPSPHWLRALDQILRNAERTSRRWGYELDTERSHCSEARYIHVCRDDVWYGIRIASHLPRYRCSSDYFQIILDDPPTFASARFANRQISDLIVRGGKVVASPSQVQIHVERRFGPDLSRHEWKRRHREIARIRHQVHQQAKWAWEIRNR